MKPSLKENQKNGPVEQEVGAQLTRALSSSTQDPVINAVCYRYLRLQTTTDISAGHDFHSISKLTLTIKINAPTLKSNLSCVDLCDPISTVYAWATLRLSIMVTWSDPGFAGASKTRRPHNPVCTMSFPTNGWCEEARAKTSAAVDDRTSRRRLRRRNPDAGVHRHHPTIERIENESYYSHYGYDRDGQTSVPLDDDFDAVTYEPPATVREEWREDHGGLQSPSPPRRADGRRRGSGEVGRVMGVGGMRRGTGTEIHARYRFCQEQDKSEIQRRPQSPPIGTSKSLLPSRNTNTAVSKPSRLGEQFEMVRRKIIEDSPQKTVTISMWRENVAMRRG
ncbi:Squalene epoxidase [Salix suchowensis]|nr:Squalene epoxidase [Salix suchowensis]